MTSLLPQPLIQSTGRDKTLSVRVFNSVLLKVLMAALLGALLPLAFAPLQFSFLAILIPCGLILLWEHTSSLKQNILLGFIFGFAFFLSGVYWIYYSIYTYGHSPLLLAYFIMGVLVAVLALFPAVLSLILNTPFAKALSLEQRYLLLYPSVWTLLEGIRAIIGSGFPWLSLGYSQTQSFLSGFAPWVGVYGLSWIAVFLSGLLFLIFKHPNKRYKLFFSLIFMAVYALGFSLSQIHWSQATGKKISVSLVQGDVSQDLKWNPWQLSENIEHYWKLSQNNGRRDLIVWPEAAIPASVIDAKPALQFLDKTLKTQHSNLFTGIVDEDEEGQTYNALILLGRNQGLYYKRHLVPFGEYLPLNQLLSALLQYWQLPNASLSQGPAEASDLKVNHIHIAPFICYEIIFPGLVRRSLPAAEVLLTISDDSWFGDSWALQQHLQMGQMRSLEMARPQLFVGNSGITAFISPQGGIVSELPIDRALVLNGQIEGYQGITPFMYWGTWPVWCLSGLLIIWVYLLGILASRSKADE